MAVWFILWKAEKLRVLAAFLSFLCITFVFAWVRGAGAREWCA